ncbi:MAG: hypothetical protein U0169_18510 [Polyangiaceae bacterium]
MTVDGNDDGRDVRKPVDVPVLDLTPAAKVALPPEDSRKSLLPSLEPTKAESYELVLLTTESMRARHRPFAIVLLWAWQSLLALVLTWPAASFVRVAYGGHPSGDAPLFRPGALDLAGLVVTGERWSRMTRPFTWTVVVVAMVCGIVPLTILLTSLCHGSRSSGAPRMRQLFPLSIANFGRMGIVSVLVLLSQVGILGIGFAVAAALSNALEPSWGTARAAGPGIATFVLFAMFATLVGILGDVTRAALVRFSARPFVAIKVAVKTLRATSVVLVASWLWRTITGLSLVLVLGMIAEKLGGKDGFALALLFTLHQLVTFSRTALRASWLASALRTVDATHRVVRART